MGRWWSWGRKKTGFGPEKDRVYEGEGGEEGKRKQPRRPTQCTTVMRIGRMEIARTARGRCVHVIVKKGKKRALGGGVGGFGE